MPKEILIKVEVSDAEPVARLLQSVDLALPHIKADIDKMDAGITDYGRYSAFKVLIYDAEYLRELTNAE